MTRGSKADTWMPLFVADYQSDTSRLTLEQHGAYLLLIMDYWRNGPPPDDDDVLARILGVDRRAWAKLRPAIARFFAITGGEWRHGRIDREITAASERKGKAEDRARAAAEARWSRSPRNATSMPQALPEDVLEECPPPSPTPEGVKEDADASSVGSAEPMPTKAGKGEPWLRDETFLEAWGACTEQMRARSSRKQAYAPWKANRAGGAEKLAALKAYLSKDPDVHRTGGPGLHLWLRDKLDEWLAAKPTAPVVTKAWDGPPEVLSLMRRFALDGYVAQYVTWRDLPAKAVVVSHPIILEKFSSVEAELARAGIALILERKAA